MTNEAPVLEATLPRNRILWRTKWHPATDRYAAMVADDGRLPCGPMEKVEWKTERGADARAWVRTWRIPLVEGAIYMRSLDDQRGMDIRFAVVREGQLVDITREQAEDLYDPAGAADRARIRHARWERQEYAISRGRREGMQAGLVYRTANPPHEAFIFVERATAKEYCWRRARPEEIEAYKA
ncbi:hypothetical protein, partial [Microvirga sp. Mcv34]|uniref:hypothetical protein n=1 Tax=Microvirga sp. Mcv34 TaxID=2926016 RepID=UPI0021C5AA4C